MKNFAALIGWLLLAAILAVPAFLFYNWWSNNKKNEARLVSVQSVSTAAIFSNTPADQEDQVYAAEPPVRKAVPHNDTPVSAAQVSPAAKAGVARSTAAVPAGTATAAQASVSTRTVLTSYYDPKSGRDPTITPAEYRRMKQDEALRREEERQRQLLLRRQQRESGCESRIALQGIVGDSVIINGDVYTVGSTVQGAKLLKIGSNYVIGECKGQRFRKVLQ